MTIKIDLANQVRQTILPRWKPLLPLFEAVVNSFQAIKDAELPAKISGHVTIEVERERTLFDAENPPIVGFIVRDNGIGLDDRNFDSFNTAFSPRKSQIGGKGLGRFTWLKAFEQALVKSTFRDDDASLQTRDFVFDQTYDLDERGLPKAATAQAPAPPFTFPASARNTVIRSRVRPTCSCRGSLSTSFSYSWNPTAHT